MKYSDIQRQLKRAAKEVEGWPQHMKDSIVGYKKPRKRKTRSTSKSAQTDIAKINRMLEYLENMATQRRTFTSHEVKHMEDIAAARKKGPQATP
jgi:hypothetical protein